MRSWGKKSEGDLILFMFPDQSFDIHVFQLIDLWKFPDELLWVCWEIDIVILKGYAMILQCFNRYHFHSLNIWNCFLGESPDGDHTECIFLNKEQKLSVVLFKRISVHVFDENEWRHFDLIENEIQDLKILNWSDKICEVRVLFFLP